MYQKNGKIFPKFLKKKVSSEPKAIVDRSGLISLIQR